MKLVESLRRSSPKDERRHEHKPQQQQILTAMTRLYQKQQFQYWKPIRVIYWLITSHYLGPSSSHYHSASESCAQLIDVDHNKNIRVCLWSSLFPQVFVFMVRFQLFSRILGTLCKHLQSPYLSLWLLEERSGISIPNSGGEVVEEEPEQEQ